MVCGYSPNKAEAFYDNYGNEDIEAIERKQEEKEDYLANYACDVIKEKLIDLEEQQTEAYLWGY